MLDLCMNNPLSPLSNLLSKGFSDLKILNFSISLSLPKPNNANPMTKYPTIMITFIVAKIPGSKILESYVRKKHIIAVGIEINKRLAMYVSI